MGQKPHDGWGPFRGFHWTDGSGCAPSMMAAFATGLLAVAVWWRQRG